MADMDQREVGRKSYRSPSFEVWGWATEPGLALCDDDSVLSTVL